MKSNEGESALKSPSKIQKREVENLRKKVFKIQKGGNISLQEWLEDLQENQMKVIKEAQKVQGDFMKPMLEEQRQVDAAEQETDRVFFAARKFIYTNVNLFVSYTDMCLQDTLVTVGRCSKKLLFWISRSNPLKNNCKGFICW